MRVKSKAMAEYIDKEQIERVRLEDSCYIIEHFKGDEIDCIIDALIEDVAPIIHAKWEHNYERYGAPIECTNCKQEAHVDKRCMFIRSLYCPNCGAKMDKE